MLAIRLQRTGRKGHAQYRMIVQESRRSPKSGAVVVSLGNYDPHTKQVNVDKEKAAFYLNHGAQPSDRVAVLLQKEGVKMPSWVKLDSKKQSTVKNADKRRSTRPVEEVVEETVAVEVVAEQTADTEAVAEVTETVEAEVVAEATPEEAPADEKA